MKHKKKNNIWQISTAVLGVIVVVLVITLFTGNISGNVVLEESREIISGDEAGEQLTEFLNQQTGGGVEYISSNNKSDLYEITVSYQGQELPVYITKDGEYFIESLVPLSGGWPSVEESNTQPVEVPKTAKPVVELFTMSYCPYGTQAEKGILPVIDLLEDSIDFDLRFVDYAMHPTDGEVEENLRQFCIQKEQEDKLNDYLTCFLKDGNTDACLTETEIDKKRLESCMSSTDKEFEITENLNDRTKWLSGAYPLFNIDKELNDLYGIQGSPTLVINGVQVESGRDSASYLQTICKAFTEENIPSECEEQLSTYAYGPGFGYE